MHDRVPLAHVAALAFPLNVCVIRLSECFHVPDFAIGDSAFRPEIVFFVDVAGEIDVEVAVGNAVVDRDIVHLVQLFEIEVVFQLVVKV